VLAVELERRRRLPGLEAAGHGVERGQRRPFGATDPRELSPDVDHRPAGTEMSATSRHGGGPFADGSAAETSPASAAATAAVIARRRSTSRSYAANVTTS
jgi:hypothetical protein